MKGLTTEKAPYMYIDRRKGLLWLMKMIMNSSPFTGHTARGGGVLLIPPCHHLFSFIDVPEEHGDRVGMGFLLFNLFPLCHSNMHDPSMMLIAITTSATAMSMRAESEVTCVGLCCCSSFPANSYCQQGEGASEWCK